MPRVNVTISDEVHQWYKEESKQIGSAISSMMAMAINDFMLQRKMMKEFKGFEGFVEQMKKITEQSSEIK